MSNDIKNLITAVILSTMVLFAWQYFYDAPRKAIIEQENIKIQSDKKIQKQAQLDISNNSLAHDEVTASELDQYINIDTPSLIGRISIKGLRFTDLNIKKYKENLDSESPLVNLLNKDYFGEFGWVSHQDSLRVPDKNTVWQCNAQILDISKPISCDRVNSENIVFHVEISVDENYLFTIKQKVFNHSQQKIKIANYGRIFKASGNAKQFAILHEGMIGAFSDVLKETTFEDISKERQQYFNNTPGSWAGFTDKYWLSAIVPDSKLMSKTNFIATDNKKGSGDKYNINYISKVFELEPTETLESNNYFFAGAKEDKILSNYDKKYKFSLFERSIDYGILYFITKPLLLLINYFHSILGNFGLAIIAVTFSLKLLMFPLASKSFRSMAKMKALAPKIEEIKAKSGDDKLKLNQELMNLYKQEKVNPAAGCLPILIQIPIFFSLYKVIFISIEMRQAKFYGWINDLSLPDPTSIWNLFGLLPWPNLGNFDIGLWPIIMSITMYIQQKLSPPPSDNTQAIMMKLMPLILLFMLYNLPSGLMIYWSFSNILSILQQYLIDKSAKKDSR